MYMPSALADLRKKYHDGIRTQLLGRAKAGHFNIADGSSSASVLLAEGIAQQLSQPLCATEMLPGPNTAGAKFAALTSDFIERAFDLLQRFRPGKWVFSTSQGAAGIAAYEQYRHLADLETVARAHPAVRTALGGDYLITPDIVVGKRPVALMEIDSERPILGRVASTIAKLTPFRADNEPGLPTLHASISCKWTMRSDRAQNTRTEALNLLRNRKGRAPHMVVVTAEPLPSRLMSIAVGTGDIDCTYHAFLYELLQASCGNPKLADHSEMLQTMIAGRRLRDVSDLPFDLAI